MGLAGIKVACFAVSIGMEVSGRMVLGVVYDPVRDECFTAEEGSGAYLNGMPIDVAAASVIVKEAGGRISDFKGGEFNIYGEETLASNGKIHEEMLEVLRLPPVSSNPCVDL